MMSETVREIQTIINNIMVSLMTIYQRVEQRKMLKELVIGFGIELDALNTDVLRVIQNIHKMNKKELEKELKN